MELVTIGQARYTVLACRASVGYIDDELRALLALQHDDLVEDVMALLESIVPNRGPMLPRYPEQRRPRIHDTGAVGNVRGLFYFRVHEHIPDAEPAVRIPWFYGDQAKQVVICTHLFVKRPATHQRTIDIEFAKAAAIRTRFDRDRARNQISYGKR